eukprot:TRINITY_DN6585_c0_g2_i2.p1 TRINITY_DN6585_c0_g2~~TRINITY_DN6585_c0_g2_i2.p1  ORF type:complete len:640 (-),score=127.87 TRINITY_DN6585_c0_g2_i2:170-2089(-)
MKDKEVDGAILKYLKKRGYKATESKLKEEASLEDVVLQSDADSASLANQILFYSAVEAAEGPKAYASSYSALTQWVHNTLECYRCELSPLLYPLFVHSYLDLVTRAHPKHAQEFMSAFAAEHEVLHLSEVQALQGVTLPSHVHESEVAKSYRTNRCVFRLCQSSFELLISFLHDRDFMILLSIINERLNLCVYDSKPELAAPFNDHHPITGHSVLERRELASKKVYWGVLRETPPPEPTADAPSSEEGAQPSAKRQKVAEDGKAAADAATSTQEERGPTRKINLPTLKEEVKLKEFEDVRKRVALSAHALPSVCFYTFLNTNGGLNSIDVSDDCSLVSAAFRDSSIRVWDLARNHRTIFGSGVGGRRGGEEEEEEDGSSRPHTTHLVGHSGAVFANKFSHDGTFLLSASADCTARLWSLHTNTNVVCYRGHNFPVWDVDFSPMGFYFATASHDRTARLWSTDRIFPLRVFAGHLSDVDTVKFHPNSTYVATGSSDKSVRLWDIQNGSCVRIMTGHTRAISSLAFHPNGRILASGSKDGSIIVWDISSGSKMASYTGHAGCVWSLSFSQEGALLASGSADNSVRIWKGQPSKGAPSGKTTGPSEELLATFPTKHTPVYFNRFSPRNLLISAGVFCAPAAQ